MKKMSFSYKFILTHLGTTFTSPPASFVVSRGHMTVLGSSCIKETLSSWLYVKEKTIIAFLYSYFLVTKCLMYTFIHCGSMINSCSVWKLCLSWKLPFSSKIWSISYREDFTSYLCLFYALAQIRQSIVFLLVSLSSHFCERFCFIFIKARSAPLCVFGHHPTLLISQKSPHGCTLVQSGEGQVPIGSLLLPVSNAVHDT